MTSAPREKEREFRTVLPETVLLAERRHGRHVGWNVWRMTAPFQRPGDP
jgi:hypothetical protein